MSRLKEFLSELDEVIEERGNQHGDYRKNIDGAAVMWSAYLKNRTLPLTGRDVALMMALFKIMRDSSNPHHDNILDLAGYAAIAAMME